MYAFCPNCGLSDGADDTIIEYKIINYSYNSAEILETKVCDICHKHYGVLKHYNFVFEENTDIGVM